MSLCRSARRPARHRLLAATVVLLVAMATPAAARADPPYGGGGPVTASGSAAPGFATVTVTPNGSATYATIAAATPRCFTGGLQTLRAVQAPSPSPGNVEPIIGARTVRPGYGDRRGRLRISLALQWNGRGGYDGTVSLVGTLPRGRRGTDRCRATVRVAVRPSSPLGSAALSPGVARYGVTSQDVTFARGSIPQPGAVLVRPRVPALGGTPRTVTVFWTGRERCVTRGRRPTFVTGYTALTARLRADGSFRGRGRTTGRGGRYRVRSSFIATGRVGADGAVRGSVRVRERLQRRGYYPIVCRTPTSKYVASP